METGKVTACNLRKQSVTGGNFCPVQAGKDRHPAASQVCHWKGHWKGALQSLSLLLCHAMSGCALKSSWFMLLLLGWSHHQGHPWAYRHHGSMCPPCPRCPWCPFSFVIARCWGARIDARDQTEDPVQERFCFDARNMKYGKRSQEDGKSNEPFDACYSCKRSVCWNVKMWSGLAVPYL